MTMKDSQSSRDHPLIFIRRINHERNCQSFSTSDAIVTTEGTKSFRSSTILSIAFVVSLVCSLIVAFGAFIVPIKLFIPFNFDVSGIRRQLQRADIIYLNNSSSEEQLASEIHSLPASVVLPTDLYKESTTIDSLKMGVIKSVESTTIEDTTITLNTNGTDLVDVHPIVFRPWPINKPLPCYEAEPNWISSEVQNTKTPNGLLFLKLYKTGSSTGSGIHLRISRNVAKQNGYGMCQTRFGHGPDATPGFTLFNNRSYENSFLWTITREPTARAISAFFHFGVTRHGIQPTNENFQAFLKDMFPSTGDYYLRALYTKANFTGRDVVDPINASNAVLNEFNFIGITERMDESAVVLMMLLNLKLADILYLNAKVNGGLDGGGGPNGCTVIAQNFISEEMQVFFESNFWKDRIRYDLKLYNAVNKSLDMTIDALGRKKFEENLALFLHAKKVVATKCLQTAKFPCDEYGHKRQPNETDCLWKDSGCGTQCLDQVSTELNLW